MPATGRCTPLPRRDGSAGGQGAACGPDAQKATGCRATGRSCAVPVPWGLAMARASGRGAAIAISAAMQLRSALFCAGCAGKQRRTPGDAGEAKAHWPTSCALVSRPINTTGALHQPRHIASSTPAPRLTRPTGLTSLRAPTPHCCLAPARSCCDKPTAGPADHGTPAQQQRSSPGRHHSTLPAPSGPAGARSVEPVLGARVGASTPPHGSQGARLAGPSACDGAPARLERRRSSSWQPGRL